MRLRSRDFAKLAKSAALLCSDRSMMVEAPEIRKTITYTPTNTLVVTKVPPALLQAPVSPSLKEFFQRYGHIEAWVPLTGFERVVVVYSDESSVEFAKEALDYTIVEGFGTGSRGSKWVVTGNAVRVATTDISYPRRSMLRVYRANPTPLDSLGRDRFPEYLPVPDTDKNFLISPPGSPPVGWEQIREDPPNADTLAADLAKALEGLAMDGSCRPDREDPASQALLLSPSSPSSRRSPRDTLIIPHRRTESGDLPSVMVSDTDIAAGPQLPSSNGFSISEAFDLQRRPPGPISRVKATIDSMQESYQFPSVSQRIDRTPRPPLGD